MKDKRDKAKLRDAPLVKKDSIESHLMLEMWSTMKSPIQLSVPADNGGWKIVKVIKKDRKGKPLKWLGKWVWNEKRQVNGKNGK